MIEVKINKFFKCRKIQHGLIMSIKHLVSDESAPCLAIDRYFDLFISNISKLDLIDGHFPNDLSYAVVKKINQVEIDSVGLGSLRKIFEMDENQRLFEIHQLLEIYNTFGRDNFLLVNSDNSIEFHLDFGFEDEISRAKSRGSITLGSILSEVASKWAFISKASSFDYQIDVKEFSDCIPEGSNVIDVDNYQLLSLNYRTQTIIVKRQRFKIRIADKPSSNGSLKSVKLQYLGEDRMELRDDPTIINPKVEGLEVNNDETNKTDTRGDRE